MLLRVAVDAMGGDHAPQEIIAGALRALEQSKDLALILVGHEEKISKYIKSDFQGRLKIHHASQYISGDDDPGLSIRKKKDSSMVKAMELVRNGEAEAVLSAGNTGALMAGGLLFLGRIKNVARPALLSVFPTFNRDNVVVLDVGANMDAKPNSLWQYAIMGRIYSQEILNKSNPSVSLLNVGIEENKGNHQARNTFPLLKENVPGFIGNVEPNFIFQGATDVLVCDGFTGNIVLKLAEGLSHDLFQTIKQEVKKSIKTKLGAALLMPVFQEIKDTMDAQEYGGALLVGLKSVCIKCHGSSRSKAIENALLNQIKPLIDCGVNEKMAKRFQSAETREDD